MEHDIEKLLHSLPRLKRSTEADRAFLRKLHDLTEEPAETHWFAMPRFVPAFATLVIILFVGTTFAAYQPSTTRGSFLYPLKRFGERVELAGAMSSLAKIDAHLRFSNRRLEEANEILRLNPSLAWLIQKASAHEGEIHLETEAAENLLLTLADMRIEVDEASRIVQERVKEPAKVSKVLAKIESTVSRQFDSLNALEASVPNEARIIVQKAKEEADVRVTAMILAQEEVSAAVDLKRETIEVKLADMVSEQMKKREEFAERRADFAKEEFEKAFKIFTALPEENRERFGKQMELAKEALEMGKFGRAEGLSRALQMRIEHAPPPIFDTMGGQKEIEKEMREKFEEKKEAMKEEQEKFKKQFEDESKEKKEHEEREKSKSSFIPKPPMPESSGFLGDSVSSGDSEKKSKEDKTHPKEQPAKPSDAPRTQEPSPETPTPLPSTLTPQPSPPIPDKEIFMDFGKNSVIPVFPDVRENSVVN